MSGRLIVWGAGELGGRVAMRWAQNNPALGFTETADRHGTLRAAGVEVYLGEPVETLGPEDTLLLCVPGYARQQAAVEQLLEADRTPPARAIMVSSTGVFPDASGRVNEQTPVSSSPRARAIEHAEDVFLKWAGEGGTVLRMGGLYRPGRGPFAVLASRREVPMGPPDRTLALIHYDDAATATVRALEAAEPSSHYVCVSAPCPSRRAFYRAASTVLGLGEPRFAVPLDQPRADYDCALMRAQLLPVSAYPDWRSALQ